MAMMINEECIDCAACVDACTNEAIQEIDDDHEHYWINVKKCTECVDQSAQQCVELCPVDSIIKAA